MELKDASLAESWGQVAHCRPAVVDPPATAARKQQQSPPQPLPGVRITFYKEVPNLFSTSPNDPGAAGGGSSGGGGGGGSSNKQRSVFLACPDRDAQAALYDLLLKRRSAMGDGRDMPLH